MYQQKLKEMESSYDLLHEANSKLQHQLDQLQADNREFVEQLEKQEKHDMVCMCIHMCIHVV